MGGAFGFGFLQFPLGAGREDTGLDRGEKVGDRFPDFLQMRAGLPKVRLPYPSEFGQDPDDVLFECYLTSGAPR